MTIDKQPTLSALAAAVGAKDLLAARAALRAYQMKLDDAALLAAYEGNADDLAHWIGQGAEPPAERSGLPTAGMHAALAGSRDCLEILESAGFDFDAELRNSAVGTAAGLAAQHGHSDALDFLIKRGVAITAKDTCPVAVAAQHGQAECLEKLLAAMLGRSEDKPVALAAAGNHIACLEVLQRHGFAMDFDDGNGETPIFSAASAGSADAIRFLGQYDDNFSPKDKFGATAILVAAYGEHIEAIETLLNLGAGLRECDLAGMNLLHYAVAGSRPNVITWAVSQAISVNDANLKGETPAHLSAKNGDVECLAALLDAGANLDIRDKQDHTVRQLAEKYKRHKILQFLDARSAQAAINATLAAMQSGLRGSPL
jgi:ankyrin repeat protein